MENTMARRFGGLSARRPFALTLSILFLCGVSSVSRTAVAQSGRQQTPPTIQKKKNKRPSQSGDQQGEDVPQDIVGTPQESETVKVTTSLVNVTAVVYNKKTRQIITNLKKENFAIYEDGVRQDITNFSTPDAPITVAMVLEYSKLTNRLGGDWFEPGRYEVIRPMAMFLSQFVKPPDDYVSVVAYDMRPTPLTDFTNDPARINSVINLLLRNYPASSEANLFDALKLVLVGGRADSVVLEDSKESKTDYAGLSSLQGRRTAVFLVCSGVDTFSKINYDQARKIAQNAGVPIYIIGTGDLYNKNSDMSRANDGLLGAIQPGRMTLLQAQNTLRTFADETGGMYFQVKFEAELPSILQTINAFLRNQYSLGFKPSDKHDGKRHKLVVKVDVNGDGNFNDKDFIIRSREYYNAPKS